MHFLTFLSPHGQLKQPKAHNIFCITLEFFHVIITYENKILITTQKAVGLLAHLNWTRVHDICMLSSQNCPTAHRLYTRFLHESNPGFSLPRGHLDIWLFALNYSLLFFESFVCLKYKFLLIVGYMLFSTKFTTFFCLKI